MRKLIAMITCTMLLVIGVGNVAHAAKTKAPPGISQSVSTYEDGIKCDVLQSDVTVPAYDFEKPVFTYKYMPEFCGKVKPIAIEPTFTRQAVVIKSGQPPSIRKL